MLSSKLLSSLVKSVTQPQKPSQNAGAILPMLINTNFNFFHTDPCKHSQRHGGDGRLYYNILKERPLGPHKKLAPNVKLDGRMGPQENYRYIVHYPEVNLKFF